MVAPSSSEESSTSGSSESAPIASDVTGQPPHPPPSQSSDVKDGDAKLKKLFKLGTCLLHDTLGSLSGKQRNC